MKKFAVFDIDGTLYRWQLFHDLTELLAREGVFADTPYEQIDEAWNKWRAGAISFGEYEKLVVGTMLSNLPHIPTKQFDAAVDKVIATSAHKLYYYPKALKETLKARGYTLIIISGSQQELVQKFADVHGFDIALGAIYERRDGAFTGQISRPTVGKKIMLLHDLIEQYDLTTQDSFAIGDSEGDIEMLSAVEHPIAFNPSSELLEHANKQGWSVVIERKNIAYRLEKQGDGFVLAETITY